MEIKTEIVNVSVQYEIRYDSKNGRDRALAMIRPHQDSSSFGDSYGSVEAKNVLCISVPNELEG